MESADFEAALAALSEGYSEGIYEGVGLRGSDDGGRYSLFERELARRGIISFNLYRLRTHNASLKPCAKCLSSSRASGVKLRPQACVRQPVIHVFAGMSRGLLKMGGRRCLP